MKYKKEAIEIFKTFPNIEILYVNGRGEFFTEKHMAINSENGNEKSVQEIVRPSKKEKETPKETKE